MDGWRRWIGMGLLLTWLGGSAVGYGWYQSQYLQPYPGANASQTVLPEALRKQLERAWSAAPTATGVEPGGVTLVHFSQPGCRCDDASRDHLRRLRAEYSRSDLAVIQALPPTADAAVPDLGEAVDRRKLPALWQLVSAVPAAALFGPGGQLLYFGPYSSGPSCGSGINFVEDELSRLRNHESVTPWINEVALGCFCAIRHRKT